MFIATALLLGVNAVSVYRWDTATTTGIQDGTGTWGTSAFWSKDNGITRGAWVPNSIARFGGGSSGTAGAVIGTASTTINLAGIIFDQPFAGNYSINSASGYKLNFVGQSTIVCNYASTINANISGGTITLSGAGVLTFTLGASTNTNTGWIITSGATMTASGNYTFLFGSATLQVNGTLNLPAGTNVRTISNVISGSGSVNTSATSGFGSITVLGNNTFTGTWTNLASSTILQIGNGTTPSVGDVGPCSLVLNSGMDVNRVGTFTMGANVSGTGVTRFIRGDITLTGTWSAGTITVGVSTTTTLRIGNGGTTGSVSSNISVSGSPAGTVSFNRSDSYTYPGVISGGGAVVHAGSGTLTFSANQTYTGATTVNSGGKLRLGGNLAATAVTITNTTGNTIGADTATTRTIAGSVTFAGSNAALDVQTNGSTVASRLTVTGGVVRGGAKVNVLGALNAGTYIIISGASATSSGAEFTIGTNLSGRTCTFSTVAGVTTMTAV